MKLSTLKATSILCVMLLCAGSSFAQFSFTNANTRLSNANFHSGVAVTVADMNGDGLDDICRMDDGHLVHIQYQHAGGQFTDVFCGDLDAGAGSAWAMCVADVDHNGHKDIIADGNSSIRLLKANATGTSYTISSLPTSNFFLQNANFMDVNNDGWEDIFGCDDNAASHIWLNNGSGGFTVSSIINFDITPTDDSGNYGSVWTDFDNDGDVDLYIAKCRQAISNPNDGRRIDVLFVNNGNGTYTSNAAMYGLADSGQTWTCNFADIDNDGDLDVIQTDYDVPAKLLRNDGTGHYTNITAGSGFALSMGQPIESQMEDFDNDGFVDILVTGDYHEMYHNNGNGTFTEIAGLFNNNDMESFATGDLNHDGKIDIYASYATIYTNPTSINDVFWMNTAANNNNFFCLNLKGTVSNKGALGARALIYGAWGTQIREVHAGESYGTCNTGSLHFGLGQATSIDSVVIKWPSGLSTHITGPAINQYMTVIEGDCVSPNNVVTSSGPMIICPAQTVALNAATGAGYSYLWSNGATTPSITVGTAGEYNVTITIAGNNCVNSSAVVTLVVNPNETPTISALADTTFCQGGSVTLSSTPASGYTWSNGTTTQTNVITTSGSYTVTITGACQNWTSSPINVNVLPASPPTSSDVNLPAPGSTTLTATGTSIKWYDMLTNGTLLGSGPTYITPFLNSTTTYYAQDDHSYGGSNDHLGQTHHAGTNYSTSGTNAYTTFNVTAPCILHSVKVYTDSIGTRIIELRNSSGTVLQSATVNITSADTSIITLDFNLTPGTNYRLGTNTAQNNLSFGTNYPWFMRSTTGVAYPYTVAGLVSITGNNQSPTGYYYFYDWNVIVPPTVCSSVRTPVTVYIATSMQDLNSNSGVEVFPNPASGFVTVQFSSFGTDAPVIELSDLSGRVLIHQLVTKADGNAVQVGLNDLAQGAYMINVTNNNTTFKQMLIVH